MDFESMTQQQKVEYIGYMEYNRMGNPDWVERNSFYSSDDGLVDVVLDNEDDKVNEDY